MSNDEIVAQMQQIVSTLQQIVQASGELAGRVETLEEQAGEKVGAMTALQGHLQLLLETYQKQIASQETTNRAVLEALGTLEARLDALESGGAVGPTGDDLN
jgi:peptidoglycan hydrolase CwlO-like protein